MVVAQHNLHHVMVVPPGALDYCLLSCPHTCLPPSLPMQGVFVAPFCYRMNVSLASKAFPTPLWPHLTSLSFEALPQPPAQPGPHEPHIPFFGACHPWGGGSLTASQTKSSLLSMTIISSRAKDRGGFRGHTVREEGQYKKASPFSELAA